MTDTQIQTLITVAVYDDVRKDLYQEALPRMTAEEKIQFVAELWSMLMAKLQDRTIERIEEQLYETTQSNEAFDMKQVDHMQDEVLNEFLRERVGVTDTEGLTKLRDELRALGQQVKQHDEFLSQIKSKFSDEE